MENKNQLFRQKTMDRISSPEELHDYMRVTGPRLWMILTAIVVLLAGFVVYAATTRMESTEKILLRMSENTGYGRIPAGREDMIRIGMEVRVNGRSAQVVQIDNNMEYVMDVRFEGDFTPEEDYYVVSMGESRDVRRMNEDGSYNDDLLYVYCEDGVFYPMGSDETIRPFADGDIRARFWKEDYSGEEPVLTGGRLATISGVRQVVSTMVNVKLDEKEKALDNGIYEAEIVTESTTPISFLLN